MDAKLETPLEKKQKEDSAEKAKGGGVTDPSPIDGSETYYADECGNFLAKVAPCEAYDPSKLGKGWTDAGGPNMPSDPGGLNIMKGGFGCMGGKTIKGTNPVANAPIIFKGSMVIPLSAQPSPNDNSSGNN